MAQSPDQGVTTYQVNVAGLKLFPWDCRSQWTRASAYRKRIY